MTLNSYLLFNGECQAAFKFYERCLGGKIRMMMTHGESPMAAKTPPEWLDKILHVTLVAGDNVLMGSDAPAGHYEKPQGFSVHLGTSDPSEAERIFRELSEGGTVQMPLQKTFWAVLFGMFVDRFGTPWMIDCGQPGEE